MTPGWTAVVVGFTLGFILLAVVFSLWWNTDRRTSDHAEAIDALRRDLNAVVGHITGHEPDSAGRHATKPTVSKR